MYSGHFKPTPSSAPVWTDSFASVNAHGTVPSRTVPHGTVPHRRGGSDRYRTVPLASVNCGVPLPSSCTIIFSELFSVRNGTCIPSHATSSTVLMIMRCSRTCTTLWQWTGLLKSSSKAASCKLFFMTCNALAVLYACLWSEVHDGNLGNDIKMKWRRNPLIDQTPTTGIMFY